MEAGLVFAEAADAERCALSHAGDEFDGLAAGVIGKEFTLVASEQLFPFFCFFRIEFEDLRDKFGLGCKRGKPGIKIAVGDPAVSVNSARWMARDADAETLLEGGGCADLKGGEVEFLAHCKKGYRRVIGFWHPTSRPCSPKYALCRTPRWQS